MQRLTKYMLLAAAVAAAGALSAGVARADDDDDQPSYYNGFTVQGSVTLSDEYVPGQLPPPLGRPLLTPPNHYLDGSGAALYPCPRPVPEFLGGTYITYPPLLPHEFTYQHRHTYCHPDGRVVRVRYDD